MFGGGRGLYINIGGKGLTGRIKPSPEDSGRKKWTKWLYIGVRMLSSPAVMASAVFGRIWIYSHQICFVFGIVAIVITLRSMHFLRVTSA